MHALLRDMEKAKSEHIQKIQRLQLLANAQHQLQKHPDQIVSIQISMIAVLQSNPYLNIDNNNYSSNSSHLLILSFN